MSSFICVQVSEKESTSYGSKALRSELDQQLPKKLGDSHKNKQPLSPESGLAASEHARGRVPIPCGPFPPTWPGAYGWNGPVPSPFMRTGGMDWMGGRMPHGTIFLFVWFILLIRSKWFMS